MPFLIVYGLPDQHFNSFFLTKTPYCDSIESIETAVVSNAQQREGAVVGGQVGQAQGSVPGRQRADMIVHNEDIKELIAQIPEGHKHLRTTIFLLDGTELVFQEAAIANLVRAYITVKTHPSKKKVILTGRKIETRKNGFAEWQLVEE